eukprot:Gb_26136 [translate_table: standard]
MGGETMSHYTGNIQMHGARPPFTPSQWQELEHQALIFKYMMAGIPVPPDLVVPIRKSLDAITAGLFHHHHHHHHHPMSWSSFQLGFAKNCDPEPGRCRRTDGKKWRCSKDAFPDSKYCERHMHRGRNRSRKPVETPTSHSSSSLSLSTARNNISSISNNTHGQHLSFATPYSASNRLGAGILLASTANTNTNTDNNITTNQFNINDSGSYAIPTKDYRYMKGDIDEHIFFSEASGTSRGLGFDSHQSMLSSHVDNGWRSMQPSKATPFSQSNFPNTTTTTKQQHSFLNSSFGDTSVESVKVEGQPLRHFFDDWPRSRDSSTLSWSDLDDDRSHRSSSTTQLSISIPINSSDFSASNSRSPPHGAKVVSNLCIHQIPCMTMLSILDRVIYNILIDNANVRVSPPLILSAEMDWVGHRYKDLLVSPVGGIA